MVKEIFEPTIPQLILTFSLRKNSFLSECACMHCVPAHMLLGSLHVWTDLPSFIAFLLVTDAVWNFSLITVLRDYGADWPWCKAHPPWHAFLLWRFIFCKVQSGKSSHTLSSNSVVRSLSDLFLLSLPGIFEKCTVNLCQAECWNKICTRDEWNFGTALLCISEWSGW
jgi:hypothetical protein